MLELGEQCDDGNSDAGDGCDANCLDEIGNGEQAGDAPPLQVGGGCGCVVVGDERQHGWPLALLGLGFATIALRRRRRR
jgi:MYXO-CTERM domain-containing protein